MPPSQCNRNGIRATPAPVNSTQWCVPLNFGEWLSKLVGKQSVCVKVDWGRETGFWPF
ncbi:hypothetical protein [Streptomyces sp. ICC4]|uniref:hypothetical protein n=1 Tax=Streptomyces sp. ICC4 TaxID=2099584 RepID=UPI0013A6FB38|nr:hypothetical protein [Streptomyces sp. ICC4]